MKQAHKLLILFLLAFTIRLIPYTAIILTGSTNALYQNDSDEYIGMGKALASGDLLFSRNAGWLPLFRTPGYPLFLSIFYLFSLGDIQISFIQLLMDSMSAIMIFYLCQLITKNDNASFLCSLLYALNPLFISFSFQLLSETFFVFVFLAFNILFVRYLLNNPNPRHLMVIALLLGFLIWIRPLSLMFPFIYGFVFYINSKNLRLTAMVVLIPLLFVFAWALRNYLVDGTFTFSATILWNVVCYYSGSVFSNLNANIAGFETFAKEYVLETPEFCTNLQFEKLSAGFPTAIRFISSNFSIFLWNSLASWPRFFEPVSTYYIDRAFGSSPLSSQVLYLPFRVYQFIVYALFILYFKFIRQKTEIQKTVLLLLGLLLLYNLIVNGPENYYRYRIPIEPFLLIFSSIPLQYILQHRKRLL